MSVSELSRPAEIVRMTTIDFATHRADLHKFVMRLVGNADLAEDVVQETLLRALSTASGFAGRSRPLTWLSAIALNVIRDHFRRASTRCETDDAQLGHLPAETPDIVLTFMKGEMGACIAGELMALPEPQRTVLALHDMAGFSHAEIAEALGVSEGHCRVLLHRARAALRTRLGQNCELDFSCPDAPCQPKQGRRS